MRRNEATGKLDFDWDATGNPAYADDNAHRVLSLLIEHRPSPGSPGYWADETGRRGSLIYTVKNVRLAGRSGGPVATPSDLEAYVRDALGKAIDEGWIYDVVVKASLRPLTRAHLSVSWRNPGGRSELVRVALSS